MGFIQDFKDFAFKGNLLDMAVGIIMGGAVAAMVQSFLKNIIAPLIARIAGVPDLSAYTIPIGGESPKLNDAGEQIMNSAGVGVTEPTQLYVGTFIQNVLDFAILALVIFIALKIAAKWMKAAEEDAPPAEDIVLLTEIRDALKK
ncbi:MAG: large conductance mechanosensitive channel protein MscL [Mariniblastus sp.]